MAQAQCQGKQPANRTVKLAVLGNGAVGKTDLLVTYVSGKYPQEYIPGPMDWSQEYAHVTKQVASSDGHIVEMSFIDTCGQDDYERLRVLMCAPADVFLICYDISNRASFEAVGTYWLPCMTNYTAEEKPFVLVGLKCDLRSEAENAGKVTTDFVTCEEGQQEAKRLRAAYFVECSARRKVREAEPFTKAVDAVTCKNAKCRIM